MVLVYQAGQEGTQKSEKRKGARRPQGDYLKDGSESRRTTMRVRGMMLKVIISSMKKPLMSLPFLFRKGYRPLSMVLVYQAHLIGT
jgi:hypothetical protein